MDFNANKSQHYDWFKGSENKGNKKMDRKKAMKTTLKFTKIFVYFSLFFFSMWGCVQSFMISTSPYVGQGVEITNSRDGISPSVASLHISSAGDIYQPEKPDNVYLSKGLPEEEVILNEIQAELAHQSGNANFSLADANKGFNVVARVSDDATGESKYLVWDGANFVFKTPAQYNAATDTPVVASSAAHGSATYANAANANISFPIYYFDQTTNTVKETTTGDFTFKHPDVATSPYAQFNMALASGLLNELEKKFPANSIDTANEALIWNHSVQNITNVIGYNLQFKVDATAGTYTTTSYAGTGPAIWIDNFVYGTPGGANNIYNHTSYTPISTWGEAFDMSKGGGPFYGLFVYPIAWLTNELVDAMPFLNGWESFLSIFIVILIMQLAAFLLSFKSTMEQAKMTELNAKKAVIEAKYAAYKGNKQMENRKKQEIAEMYKKEGVSQLGPMAGMLITMPIFLAMWRVVGSIQHFKGTEWLGINFAASSMSELFSGEWQYTFIIVMTIATQVLSTLFPRMLTKRRDKNRINVHQKAAMKKSNKTQNIMMIVFGVMTVMFNAGLQLYMIIRSVLKIFETLFTHYLINRRKRLMRENGGELDKFDWKKIFKKKPKSTEPKPTKEKFNWRGALPKKATPSKVRVAL